MATLDQLILSPFLFHRAARREGLYDIDEVQGFARRKRDDLLLELLRKTAIAAQVEVSAAEIRQFYDDHPETFTHETATWAEELLLPSAAEARRLRDAIANDGALFEDLVGQSLRPDAVENKARFHFHPRDRAVYPKLLPAILAAAKGEVMGPVEVEGGYSVFRVLHEEEEGVQPFEQVQRRARALLLRKREEASLQVFLQELRQKYAAQIHIDLDALEAALPDSLIQG